MRVPGPQHPICRSLLERMVDNGMPLPMLTEQYRMVPQASTGISVYLF